MHLQTHIFRDLFILSWALMVGASRCNTHHQEGDDSSLTVTTKTGAVKGKLEKIEGYEAYAYLGIPYAAPPIGERRFRKPDPINSWHGVLETTVQPPPCMQYNVRAGPWVSQAEPSEDCLFLNIWVPSKCSDMSSNDKLPVMVWIHGGGFYAGSIDVNVYNGAIMVAHENVIVVSMNYRLGVFGFLDAGISDAPGNVGLHDQTLALKWVKDNIENFGGDPDNIAIFGESAGSVSVGLHLVSPQSKGLFNRAIMQSCGLYNEEFGLNHTVAKLRGSQFATAVGCADEKSNPNTDLPSIIRCLRSKDPIELAKLESKMRKEKMFYFSPSSGNDFLPKSAAEMLETTDIQNIPLLIGTTKDEGSLLPILMYPEVFGGKSAAHLTHTKAKAIIEEIFENSGIPVDDVTKFYLSRIPEDDTESMIKAVFDSFGDYLVLCPSVYTAEETKSDVYFYFFTHIPSHSIHGPLAGSAHFDDVQFVFGSPLRYPQSYTPEEVRFSKDIMKKWTTFAKTGSPIEFSSDAEWPKYTKTNPMYRELNPTSKNIERGLRTEVCNFWRKYLKTEPSAVKEEL